MSAPPIRSSKELAAEKYLVGLTPAAFSDRAAHYLAELNALHPFREGNGRAQREFVSHLAQAAGYYLAWEHVKPPDMLEASIESFQGDSSKFAALIRENLHPLDPDSSTHAQVPKKKVPRPKHP